MKSQNNNKNKKFTLVVTVYSYNQDELIVEKVIDLHLPSNITDEDLFTEVENHIGYADGSNYEVQFIEIGRNNYEH